jgi:hypothetical protein
MYRTDADSHFVVAGVDAVFVEKGIDRPDISEVTGIARKAQVKSVVVDPCETGELQVAVGPDAYVSAQMSMTHHRV